MRKIFLLITLALSAVSVAHDEDDFLVTLEVLKIGEDKIRVLEEPPVVPFITGEGGQQFRLIITPQDDGKSYSYYSISYLPGKPKVLEGYDEPEQIIEADDGYVSQVRTYRGKAVSHFVLHEGDPLGEYRIEVYINDQRLSIFTFDVVAR